MPPISTIPWEITLKAFPSAGVFPAEGAWLRGLIRTEATSPAVDVRAQVAGKITYGYCDRLHVDQGKGTGFLRMEFTIFLRPAAGRHQLKLEFYDVTLSCWRKIFECEIKSEAPSCESDRKLAAKPDAGWVLLQTLRRRHAQPLLSWRRHAQEAWIAGAADTIEIEPVPPLFGCLEEPGAGLRINRGLLSISGWVAHATRAVVRVTAYVDPRMPSFLDYGLPRRDVAEVFSHLHNAARSQFSGEVIITPSHPQPWSLVIGVELDDGERCLAFAKRVRGPSFAEDLPGELPPYSAMHFGAAAMVVLTARGRRILRRTGRELAAARRIYLRYAAPLVDPSNICYQMPALRPGQSRPLSVVVVNDNFTLGGAALFAFEYSRFLADKLGWRVRLASPQDGPLHALCTAAGIPVEILDVASLADGMGETEFQQHIGRIASGLDWGEVDGVIVNTMVAYWAVHLARAMGKPALFYIHESARIEALFSATQVPRVEAAIAKATRAVFVTEWTRVLHGHLERRNNFRLLRSWTDIARLDEFAARHDRATLRQTLGFPVDAIVGVCLGSICDRKGQRLLVRAIEQLVGTATVENKGASSPLYFLLVGACPSPDVDQLRRDIAVRGLDGLVRLIDETPDPLGFLLLSDIYVCPSFEEGFPRALMEASVFQLQIVTTRICGIPEMLREQEAWLVPPGDPLSLAGALREAMKAHCAGDFSRPHNARARIEQLFSATDVLPGHAALICEAVAPVT